MTGKEIASRLEKELGRPFDFEDVCLVKARKRFLTTDDTISPDYVEIQGGSKNSFRTFYLEFKSYKKALAVAAEVIRMVSETIPCE